MAGARGLEAATVSGAGDEVTRKLFAEPQTFDFFQAVRLLHEARPDRAPVGEFGEPENEVVRFETRPRIGFPASEIQSLEDETDDAPARMIVNFLGLLGQQGALPLEYSLFAAQRARAGDRALTEFLGMFDHRAISLFYRAWARSRPDVAFAGEAGQADADRGASRSADWLTRHLLELAGLGTPAVRDRLPFDDATLLHYTGLLALPSRPAAALEQMLSDYFDVPVNVEQFIGAWYPLESAKQSALGDGGLRVALGEGAVAGDEVWDQQARVRVRIGPLTRVEYDNFLPGGASHDALRGLTRFFGNDQFDFEVQLVLRRDDAPLVQLGADDAPVPLGWATWLRTNPLDRDPDDAIFAL
jgi:type VI secretion system protein ImpH